MAFSKFSFLLSFFFLHLTTYSKRKLRQWKERNLIFSSLSPVVEKKVDWKKEGTPSLKNTGRPPSTDPSSICRCHGSADSVPLVIVESIRYFCLSSWDISRAHFRNCALAPKYLNLNRYYTRSTFGYTRERSPLYFKHNPKYVYACLLSHFSLVRLFAPWWTVAPQAPLSMKFSRQEFWSGSPCPPPRDLPNPGIEPESLTSPASAGVYFFFTTCASRGTPNMHTRVY